MKEHPILFSRDMVRAILEERKTQTRRAVKMPAGFTGQDIFDNGQFGLKYTSSLYGGTIQRLRPKWDVGDRLWVREKWAEIQGKVYFAADYEFGGAGDLIGVLGKWKPSIHMPRKISRLMLEITAVRVERLNDISNADAVHEGIEPVFVDGFCLYGNYGKEEIGTALRPIESFRTLWESINGPDSWEQNPFVWVITFKRINP